MAPGAARWIAAAAGSQPVSVCEAVLPPGDWVHITADDYSGLMLACLSLSWSTALWVVPW